MIKRDVLNSPRLSELKKYRRNVFLNKILLSLSALVAILILLAYVSRIPSFNIGDIDISGNKVIDSESINEITRKEITGNYLWVFSKNNILLYPKKAIENELRAKFKRIKNINISVGSNRTLELNISERTALYTWCGEIMNLGAELPNGEKCYFLDKDGYIFDEAPYFSGEVYFKFYGVTDGSYFSKDKFPKLILFKKDLEDMSLKSVALYIQSDGDTKVFLSREKELSMNPYIIFKTDSDLEKVAENLQAAITTEPLQSNLKNKYSSLGYIDLRYGNKVYYKFSAQGGSASGGK